MANFRNSSLLAQEVVGLLPAGGQATRVAPLPLSKELYPIGFWQMDEQQQALRPKVACHYLLEKMRLAGVTKTYIILRKGKWDIPAYLGDGAMLDMHLAYLMMHLPFGVPYTLDQAYPFVQDALVTFGFPDIIFQPEDAFVRLIDRQADTKADIVLGLFPADQPHKVDMVDLDDRGQICQVVIKPLQSDLRYTWIIAVWTPVFAHFMHEYLLATQTGDIQDKANNHLRQRELFVGHIIQAAIQADLRIETVLFPDGLYLDIGTPEGLLKGVANGTAQIEHFYE
jgi:glucose-1-phosphate thymidylyltransferase